MSGSAIRGFIRKQKKDQQAARDAPVHREMKFVSDEGTNKTQTHTEVRREMREKNLFYLMAELEDHYANASKCSPALPSTLWERQREPKQPTPFLLRLNWKL